MARRRVPARGRSDAALMAIYGDITSRERAQQQAMFQHQLNTQLARLQKELELENARVRQRIDTGQQLIPQLTAGDMTPEQFIGAGLAEDFGGEDAVRSIAATPQRMLSPFLKQTREATTREAVPGEEDIFSSLKTTREEVADPVIEGMIANIDRPRVDPRTPMLNEATSAMQARESRLADMTAAEDRGTEVAGQTAFAQQEQGALGREAADVTSFPAQLQRTLQETREKGAVETQTALGRERQMNQILTDRARMQKEAETEVEQSAADVAGLVAVASSAPTAQNLIDTIVGPQGADPTSGRPYAQDPYALANTDPATGIRATTAFKSAFGPAKGVFQGYLDPNVQARISRLTSQQTLQALTDLRKQTQTGASPVGQASDRDVQIITSGVTQLASFRMDPAAAEAELKRIYDAALRMKQRAEAATLRLGAGGRLPSAVGIQNQMLPPQTPVQPGTRANIRTSSGFVGTVREQ